MVRSASPLISSVNGGNCAPNHIFSDRHGTTSAKETAEWLADDQDDINMLHGFGSLTSIALLDKVKELHDLAFQLGLEESREMTRGKFLDVLAPQASDSRLPLRAIHSTFRRVNTN